MKKSVFRNALCLFLCAVLLMEVLPVGSRALGLTDEDRQAVLSRRVSGWFFPLPEEYYGSIIDYAGCAGSLDGGLCGPNYSCSYGHDGNPSNSLYVRVGSGVDVYAPTDGIICYSDHYDSSRGYVAVIEQPASGGYSCYIILGNLSGSGVYPSGSYVNAGSTVASTGGELTMCAVMDLSGRVADYAANASAELEGKGWLTASEGTGLLCVNPSRDTYSAYSPAVTGMEGPVTYSFVPFYTPPVQTDPVVPETEATDVPHTEHVWDSVYDAVAATHTEPGQRVFTCTACGATRTEEIPAEGHLFTLQNPVDAYLASPASCAGPARYYLSCACGAQGYETFSWGEAADHLWGEGVVTITPSHTAGGQMTYTCSVCSAAKTEEIPVSADHIFDQQNLSDTYLASAATCSGPAVYYYSCICGAAGTETFVYGAAADHSWDGGNAATPATHTSSGQMIYTCTLCGATKAEEIPADANHVYDRQDPSDSYLAAPATCAEAARYYYSCICGEKGTETFVWGEAGSHSFAAEWSSNEEAHWHAATCGHNDQTADYAAHVWDEGTVTTVPTHTVAGSIVYQCACGRTKMDVLPPSAEHSFDQLKAEAQYLAGEATCTEPAQYYLSCICGEKGTETFPSGDAKGHTFAAEWSRNDTDHWHAATCGHADEKGGLNPHNWGEGRITVDAGHAKDGEKVYTCECGQTRTEVLPGQPHEYNQQVVKPEYLAAAADCTNPAQYYFTCVCGLKGTSTFSYGEAKGHTFSDSWSADENSHWQAATCGHTGERIKVAGHIWDPGQITVQPTATTKGVKTYTCAVCGRTKTEEVAPSTHQHTYSTAWTYNTTYHWHPATCEHTSEVTGVGVHNWNGGIVATAASHNSPGVRIFTCLTCGATKQEAVAETHVYDRQLISSAYLKSEATCTSPALYYLSCSCGAKGTETFAYGSAAGHTASSTWGKDANYHWTTCVRCGARGNLTAHTYNSAGSCTSCGYSKQDSHVHSSHLTRVPAKNPTCTQPGNISYYICDCGMWFADVTTASAITDKNSVVLPAAGHTDKDGNGRCDVCKERIATETVEYQITDGAEAVWLTTSNQGLVFRSNAEYDLFDHVEVDGVTISSRNYTVTKGSTVVQLSSSYLKLLSEGRHTIAIVSRNGRASGGFTVRQGSAADPAATSGGSSTGVWLLLALVVTAVAIAIPASVGYAYYRRKTSDTGSTGGGRYSR